MISWDNYTSKKQAAYCAACNHPCSNRLFYCLILIQLPRHHRHFHFTDRLRDLDLTRTGFSAIESRMTARRTIRLAHDLQAFGGGFVSAVEDKAMRGYKRSGAEVMVTGPE